MSRNRKSRNPDRDAVWSELEDQRQRNADRLSTPIYSTKILITKRGIPRTVINNWNTRGEFTGEFSLDADAERDGHRAYSGRDAIFLSGVFDFSAIGAPLDVAKKAGKLIADCIIAGQGVKMAFGTPQLVAFRRDQEWWLVPTINRVTPAGVSLPEKEVPAHVYANGKWRTESIGDRLNGAPALRVVFDISEFGTRVLSDLGLSAAVISAGASTKRSRS